VYKLCKDARLASIHRPMTAHHDFLISYTKAAEADPQQVVRSRVRTLDLGVEVITTFSCGGVVAAALLQLRGGEG
jgi:hypothetical protein